MKAVCKLLNETCQQNNISLYLIKPKYILGSPESIMATSSVLFVGFVIFADQSKKNAGVTAIPGQCLN
jgi:hypothetical protein